MDAEVTASMDEFPEQRLRHRYSTKSGIHLPWKSQLSLICGVIPTAQEYQILIWTAPFPVACCRDGCRPLLSGRSPFSVIPQRACSGEGSTPSRRGTKTKR